MKVYLSNSDYLRNLDSFLQRFDPSSPDRLDILTHDKWVSVHPAILAIVAALAKNVLPENIHFDQITARSGHYLDRMGLFQALGKKSPYTISKHESAGRFVPITEIKTQADQTRFITEIIPLLHLKPSEAGAVSYIVGELLRNVLEHSRSTDGAFVAAQYYADANMIRLGICDTGIGIWKSLKETWPVRTDVEAIKLALTPGVTGTTARPGGTDFNAGAGLFFVKSIAYLSRDYFVLYSGKGLYKLTKRDKRTKGIPRLHANPQQDKHAESNEMPNFQGTLVAIDISLDNVSEFALLLSVIRQATTDAAKARRQHFKRQPRFT